MMGCYAEDVANLYELDDIEIGSCNLNQETLIKAFPLKKSTFRVPAPIQDRNSESQILSTSPELCCASKTNEQNSNSPNRVCHVPRCNYLLFRACKSELWHICMHTCAAEEEGLNEIEHPKGTIDPTHDTRITERRITGQSHFKPAFCAIWLIRYCRLQHFSCLGSNPAMYSESCAFALSLPPQG